ncbi:MAG: magnesium transporter [Deltaproteobacteria bacterium]|nr:magnesium transporter [Deltaproteobacteria bacterium]
MLRELLTPEIRELIEEKKWHELKEGLLDWPAADIADLATSLGQENMSLLLRLLPKQLAADVFTELDLHEQVDLLQRMGQEHVQGILSELDPDDRTGLFEELPGKVTQRLLNLLPPEDRKESLRLLGFPDSSVGRLMTPDYVAIRPHWTVERAMAHVRRYGRDAETINMIYVVDDAWHLVDEIPLRRLILADGHQRVESLMDRRVISISAFEDQEQAVAVTKRYDLSVIPVVDSENVLLGIVTVDDILDVLEEETTEDLHKGSGVVPFRTNYSGASVWTLYNRRVVWLSLLAVSGFLSGSVISYFERTLATVISLAFFIPVLIDTGGNTSSQSATLIIRALATGDLTLGSWFEAIKKELLVGLPLGLTLGIILFVWSYLWKGVPRIGLVVGISTVVIVLWANIIGSLLPIILTRLKLDPAVISSPLLTTFLDITGLLIYFSTAAWLLGV